MSSLILWGTGTGPGGATTRERMTSDEDQRITSDGDVRIVDVLPIYLRITSEGDTRITSEGDERILEGFLGPQLLESANVTVDGEEPFRFLSTTQPWQPAAQGGENEFRWAFFTVSWSMGATLRITPTVDGGDGAVDLPDGGTIRTIRTTFVLEQQAGSLQRLTRMIAVPLVRALTRNGTERARWALRGERLQLTIESTGALGVGELMLDGIELDSSPIRKAIYATVDASR